jgi:hypothetical protein
MCDKFIHSVIVVLKINQVFLNSIFWIQSEYTSYKQGLYIDVWTLLTKGHNRP